MDFLDWANNRTLPRALQSRVGWAKLFEHHRSAFPHVHQIELTNHCTYSCIMCPRDKHMKRKIGYMDFHLFSKIISEIKTYPEILKRKEIELFHFGESLYHPRIVDMVQLAADSDLNAVLSINPALLTDEHIERLPAAGPARIIISLDSMDENTYREIRGEKADLSKAIENTERLLTSNAAANHNIPIVVRMILMNCNRHESDTFTEYWQERGATTELRDFFPWNKQDIAGLGKFKRYPPYMPCPFPWQYMVIHWNGDVVPCCRDYNAEIPLGNVNKTSLTDIWKDEPYVNFRNKMATDNQLPECCIECLELYFTTSTSGA